MAPNTSANRFRKLDSYWSERLREIGRAFTSDMLLTWRRTQACNLSILASSLSFFCAFSSFPFLILCFLGSHYLVGAHRLPPREVAAFFETLVPNMAPWIQDGLLDVINRNLLDNVLGLVLLGASAHGLFTCLQAIFARLSPQAQKRSFLLENLIALVCFSVAAVAMTLLVLALTARPEVLRQLILEYVSGITVRAVARISLGLAVAAVLLTLTIVYKLLPLQPVSWVAAFRGGALFLAFFALGRAGYQSYMSAYRVFNESTYGNFFSLVSVFVWLYYLSSAFIFSAQYSLCLAEKQTRKRRSSSETQPATSAARARLR